MLWQSTKLGTVHSGTDNVLHVRNSHEGSLPESKAKAHSGKSAEQERSQSKSALAKWGKVTWSGSKSIDPDLAVNPDRGRVNFQTIVTGAHQRPRNPALLFHTQISGSCRQLLHMEAHCGLVVRRVPCAGGEPSPPRQGTYDFGSNRASMLSKGSCHGEEGRLVGTRGARAVMPAPFVWEIIAICELFGHRRGLDYNLVDPHTI